MNKVIPGIFCITLSLKGFSPGSVNVYVLRDKNAYAIIDTGWDIPASVESLRSQLGEIGVQLSEIKKVILTHCHTDHLGMMGRLHRDNGAVVYIHQAELDIIKFRYTNDDSYWRETDRYLRTNGIPQKELSKIAFKLPNPGPLSTPDVLLDDGDEIDVGEFKLSAINTPGHTPGHICLYEPVKKLLFSGDTLLPTIATNAATHVQHMVNPVQQYLDSLARLKELDIDLVLPGHEYVFSGHRPRIEEIFQHYGQKRQNIIEVFRKQSSPLTAYDVARQLSYSPGQKMTGWDRLGGWDKRFAMMQTIALLEQLAFGERLTRSIIEGMHYYQSPKLI